MISSISKDTVASNDLQFFLEAYGLSSDEIAIYVSCINSLLELNRFFESFKADPNQKEIALYKQLEAYTIDWPAIGLFAHTILKHRFGSQVADGCRDLATSYSSQGTFLDFSKSLSHISEEAFLFAYGLVLLSPPLIAKSELAESSDLMQTAGGIGGHPLSSSQIGRTQISSNKARLESLESLRTSEDLNTLSYVYVPADDLTLHVKGELNSTDAVDNNRADSSRQSASLSGDRRSEALLSRHLDESKDDLVISLKKDGFSQTPSSDVRPVVQREESIRQVVDSLEQRLAVTPMRSGFSPGLEVTEPKPIHILPQSNDLGASDNDNEKLISELESLNKFSNYITNEEKVISNADISAFIKTRRTVTEADDAINSICSRYISAKDFVRSCLSAERDIKRAYKIPAIHRSVTQILYVEGVNAANIGDRLEVVKNLRLDAQAYLDNHKRLGIAINDLKKADKDLNGIVKDMNKLAAAANDIEEEELNFDNFKETWRFLDQIIGKLDANPVVGYLEQNPARVRTAVGGVQALVQFNKTYGPLIGAIETNRKTLTTTYEALTDVEANQLIAKSQELEDYALNYKDTPIWQLRGELERPYNKIKLLFSKIKILENKDPELLPEVMSFYTAFEAFSTQLKVSLENVARNDKLQRDEIEPYLQSIRQDFNKLTTELETLGDAVGDLKNRISNDPQSYKSLKDSWDDIVQLASIIPSAKSVIGELQRNVKAKSRFESICSSAERNCLRYVEKYDSLQHYIDNYCTRLRQAAFRDAQGWFERAWSTIKSWFSWSW
jgi:DNA repair exonuclease SbcCD ATPase subunit